MYALRGPRRPRVLDLPRQRCRQGRPGARQRDPVLRRLRRPRVRAEREHRPPDLGRQHRRRALRVRLGQLLLDARRSPSAASTWATPTVACTRSPPARASSRGRPPPAPTCTPRPPSPTCRDSARPSTSAPTTATSTRSTRSRGRSAGRHPVGNRISGSATIVDGVVYFSALGSRTTRGLNARTGPAGVLVPRRRVQPGRRRRRRDLPERLFDALPDASEDAGTAPRARAAAAAGTPPLRRARHGRERHGTARHKGHS